MTAIRIEFAHPPGRCEPVETITKLLHAGKLTHWRPDPSDTGDCEESCYDLSFDLVANGYDDFTVASGEIRSGESRVNHMWLEWDGFVVDVSNAGVRRGKYIANDPRVMFGFWQPQNVKRWSAREFVATFRRI